jgi:hypothetical protein
LDAFPPFFGDHTVCGSRYGNLCGVGDVKKGDMEKNFYFIKWLQIKAESH